MEQFYSLVKNQSIMRNGSSLSDERMSFYTIPAYFFILFTYAMNTEVRQTSNEYKTFFS